MGREFQPPHSKKTICDKLFGLRGLDECYGSECNDPLTSLGRREVTREVIAELLTAQGYAVALAADGVQARAQVAAALIAVTAHAMVTEHERIYLAGCNACVSKPVDFKLLRQQLEQWLASDRIPLQGMN